MQSTYGSAWVMPTLLSLILATACHNSKSGRDSDDNPREKQGENGDDSRPEPITDQDLGLFQVRATAIEGSPLARQLSHAFVNDGHVIIWGGSGSGGDPDYTSGAVFDPVANTWSPMADAPLTSEGFLHPIWTGQEFIVWDNLARSPAHAGAIYTPSSNSWRLISKDGAPSVRDGTQTAWNGQMMLTIGGNRNDSREYNREVFSYDPAANRWSRLADAPEDVLGRNFEWSWGIPAARSLLFWEMDTPPAREPRKLVPHRFSVESLEWTPAPQDGPQPTMGGVRVTAGSKAFVWGGMISHLDSGELSGQGFLYDPATNSWIEVKTPDGIRPRLQMGAAALGPQVLVFGGCLDGKLFSTECSQHSNDGFLVDADQAVARKISSDGAPQNLQQPRIHPIGRGFLVMEQSLAGSKVEGAYYYSPEEDSWTRLDLQSALTSRVNHVAIPIDSNTLMIWGGLDSKGISRAGAVIQFVPPGPE